MLFARENNDIRQHGTPARRGGRPPLSVHLLHVRWYSLALNSLHSAFLVRHEPPTHIAPTNSDANLNGPQSVGDVVPKDNRAILTFL